MAETVTTERPRFYFVDEVATILRRSEHSVRWLIATKQLKVGKVGGRVCIRPDDLDAFIDAGFADA
ncbi:excisionase family DNA binding protein [Microbacterium sp. ZKA21]|uniref:helix-turn-helix domain-containing protein n=1 Tax=Microbacterium sp. ZKA21 TaxID=3381694 RepID=UPI003D21C26C